jgi:hypothetical protein
MKKLLFTLSLFAFTLAGLRAPAASAAELETAAAYLEKTRAAVLAATKGLSAAQWKFKADPARWSVAETLEHIASAEDMLRGLVKDQVMKAPPRPAGEDVKAIDDFVLTAIPDRTQKAKSPEPLIPTNRYGSPDDARTHFESSRAATLAFLKATPGLRDHAIDSPLGKRLDGYQWLLFIAAHSERHTKQIEEVKADAGFPKK